MKIRSINPTNINKIRNAFYEYLLDHQVRFDVIGLTQDQDKLVFFFENKEIEKAHVFEFEAMRCIGFEPSAIAKGILEPALPSLKSSENRD